MFSTRYALTISAEEARGYVDGEQVVTMSKKFDRTDTPASADMQNVMLGRDSDCYGDMVHYKAMCVPASCLVSRCGMVEHESRVEWPHLVV